MAVFSRRAWLAAAFQPPKIRVPTDPQRMNAFAEAYNIYARLMQQGMVDVKQWERVVRLWERLA